MQPEGAFARVVTAMEAHLGTAPAADFQKGVVRSSWIEGDPLRGSYYQIIATVVRNPADRSASVSLVLRSVRCNLVTKLSTDKGRWCTKAEATTKEAAAFDRFYSDLRREVYRWQET